MANDEPLDQPTHTNIVVNGTVSKQSAASLKAVIQAAPTASVVYKFSHNYSHQVGHQVLQYRARVAYALEPAVAATLLAVSAPMTIV